MIRRGQATLLAISVFLGACSLLQGGIRIDDAWVRPALAGSNSAVYFRLTNTGQPDRLIGVAAGFAPEAAVYRTRMDEQGFLHMDRQDDLLIPGETELLFEPGGLHVMLLGLTQDLLLEEQTSITLVFENAGAIAVDVVVETR